MKSIVPLSAPFVTFLNRFLLPVLLILGTLVSAKGLLDHGALSVRGLAFVMWSAGTALIVLYAYKIRWVSFTRTHLIVNSGWRCVRIPISSLAAVKLLPIRPPTINIDFYYRGTQHLKRIRIIPPGYGICDQTYGRIYRLLKLTARSQGKDCREDPLEDLDRLTKRTLHERLFGFNPRDHY